MSVVPTPQGAVGKNPMKKKGKKKPPPQQRERFTLCILCRKTFSRREAQEHMHGMLHHRELESALGRDVFHECQACKVHAMGLDDYTQHISTPLHRAKLQGLISRNAKPLTMEKTLSQEAISWIQERNKTLKKEEKKQKGKKKKKQKQIAAQKRLEKVQGSTKRSAVASNVVKMLKSKQVNQRTQQQMQRTLQKGGSNVVVQNKENKVSSVQRPLHRSETTPQNQSGRLAGSSGQPAGRTWHCDRVREQFPQPGSHMSSHTSSFRSSYTRYSDNFSIHNQLVNVEHSQTGRLVNRPDNTHDSARTDMSEQMTWSDNSRYDAYYSRQYSGATMFDHNQNGRTGSSQPGQESSHRSSSPASANRSSGAAPLRDADISTMLRQVRRTLGVREPCRADREARRQNSEASDRVADRSTTQQTGAAKGQPSGAASTSVQYPRVTIFVPAAPSGVRPSNVAPATPKQTTVKVTQEMTGNTTSSEQSNHRVRIAHEPGRCHTGKEAGRKSLNSSGVKYKLSWNEMYNKQKRERQVSITRTPRLRIELSNPPPEHSGSTQPPDADLPLSEGFQWESIPGSPSVTHLTLPLPPQDTTEIESHKDEQSGSLMQEPGTSDQGASGHTVTAAPGQAEPSVRLEDGGLSSANKRKHNKDDGISEKKANGKKKITNSNKDQAPMDQLLAVSLREDKLIHSLQDLDISLIQARNVLQVAYAQVQRILLLRQQFSDEVNTLRAKRIEILQGMQESFSGASNITTASSAGAAAPLQPRPSPLPSSSAFLASSSQQPSATTSASPISPPRPTPTSVKAEATAAQASQIVSSSTDAPHVPLNQPVPSCPSELLPPLLLGPSHSAAPTTSAAAASTSVNIGLQQGQESREASKDCVRRTRLSKEDAWMILSDSEEETRGNLGREAADKPLPEIVQDSSDAAPVNDDGNESDDSVKVMEPPDPVVINLDESEDEDLEVSAHPEQQASSVELSSASTQTFQQNEVDRPFRKRQITLPVKAAKSPAESVEDEEPSLGKFLSHAGAVHGMQVHEGLLYTCSGDNTARAHSLTTRESKAVFEGHKTKVNCLLVSSVPSCQSARLYTGSSDQTIRCYSIKSKKCLQEICSADRVLCLHIAWNILYAGLANGSVFSYDLKTLKLLDVFQCHGPRGVSCMGTSQEGGRQLLLVGSYDCTVSIRDAKSGLLLRSLEDHTKTVLCMKVVNDLVFSGSSDTFVQAHNIHTGELLRTYKGHGHAVTSIVILGKVMVTACLDQLVRVFDLQSHDCLQVCVVHSDMVMCMTIHKSVIYTGCYDGSIQATKLDLLKNYRCWWQNCSFVFGMAEHLVLHLVGHHSKPSLQMVKCRWKGCDKFFSTQQSVQQKLPDHMRNHVENDSKTQPGPKLR